MKVLMVGADRSVHGGVSSVVNNYYEAGLNRKIELCYIGTMVDGSKLRKLLKAFKAYVIFLGCIKHYDIVHINMASDSSYYRKLYFIYAARLFHKKIVIHQHGGDFSTFYYQQSSPKQRKRIQKNLNYADKFVVLTQAWKEFFSHIVQSEKLVVLPNAVFVPQSYEKDYNNQDMLFLGRLCKDKGLRELFRSVEMLYRKAPQIHLYLGGTWEDTELQQEMEQHKEYITWLGWINGEKKDELLRKCAIYVLPSYYEGMPVSVLEGMAYGCVPVVTKVGGLIDIIEGDKDGIFVEPQDQESLYMGLEQVIQSRAYREKLGQQARQKVVEHYEIHDNIEQLLKVYQDVLGCE